MGARKSCGRAGLVAGLAAAGVLSAGGPAAARAGDGSTSRVSVSSHEVQGNGPSAAPTISATGRFVVFHTEASNLSPDWIGIPSLYLRDRQTGTTTLIASGVYGHTASVSSDGRYVAFAWDAYLYVLDRRTGVQSEEHAAPGGRAGDLQLSDDGRWLLFTSTAPAGPGDTDGTSDVFLKDRRTGIVTLISVSTAGEQGNDSSWEPSLSSGGRYVAFTSMASNLVPGDINDTPEDPMDGHDVFVRDLRTGTTTLASVSTTGVQTNGGGSMNPTVSANGRYVTFQDWSTSLNPDGHRQLHIYLRDRWSGTTDRISESAAGVPGDQGSWEPRISTDGRYIAYYSDATNLVPGDTNEFSDAFRHDRRTGVTTRVSVRNRGGQANGPSYGAAMTADGRTVAFQSYATNLIRHDTNGVDDVFVRDLR